MFRPAVVSIFLLSAISFGTFAQITADQKRLNLESFDFVWNTVREKHWDASLDGESWQKVREELRPRIEKASSNAEARAVIQDMLSRLHLTHFAVFPGSVYRDLERPKTGDGPGAGGGTEPEAGNLSDDPGALGIDVRVVEGEAVVFRVEADSDAYRRGVRPGWLITKVDDEDLAPVLRRVAAAYDKSTEQHMMLAYSVIARLNGPLNNPVEAEFRNGRNQLVSLTLTRHAPRGEAVKFGFMPEEHLLIDSGRAAADVPFFGFNLFVDPPALVPAFEKSVRACMSCPGFIIDLRGNPGGVALIASGLAGFFIDQPQLRLGTLHMRDLALSFTVNPRPPVYEGRVAVLIDGLSASTSEIFAAGLKDLGRARIFGTRSAGAALPSQIERLPNGDGFQFATASYQSESGRTLEGEGVMPDDETPLTRAALLSGHDPAVDAAVAWIHSGTTKGTVQ